MCIVSYTLGNKAYRPKSKVSSEVGPANRTKSIERGIKSRPKLKRGQTSDDEWFSTESTLSESETKNVSKPSIQEESDSTCKIYTMGKTIFQRSILILGHRRFHEQFIKNSLYNIVKRKKISRENTGAWKLE